MDSFNNDKVFNCIEGNIYKLPLNNNIKPIIALRIDKNLGHNSIKTTCLQCNAVDTYSKSDLESGKVYLCKSCGKKSPYINMYANLIIEKVKETNGELLATCKCSHCGIELDYSLKSLINGKITSCKKCLSGLKVGKRFGKYTVYKIGKGPNNAYLARFQCDECGAKSTPYTVNSILGALKQNKDITKMICCECSSNLKAAKHINVTNKQDKKVSIPRETDFFKDIEIDTKAQNAVIAECKNCGIRKSYTIKHILDGEPCSICKGLEVGDTVAIKKLNNNDLKNIKLSEDGKQHLNKINNRLELKIADNSSLKYDFMEAKSYRRKFKPAIKCKCNNCLNITNYQVDDIETDISKCSACDFDIIKGSIRGSGSNEQIVKDIKMIGDRSFIDLECSSCSSVITMSKIDYKATSMHKCYICDTKRKYGITDNSLIGDIFALNPIENINGYTKVGKYIILNNKYDSGKYYIKAQCSECGVILEQSYVDMKEFNMKFSDGQCEKCDSIMSETRNYINNNNWLGYIKNCRIVKDIESHGDTKIATVECLLCNDIQKVPLTVFLYSGNCVCTKCMNTEVIVRCPSCNQVHENGLTLKRLYEDNSSIECPVTKKKVSISLYKYSNEHQSRLKFLMDNYSEIGNIEEVPGSSELVRSTDKYYVGTDGKKYFTCYCEKHNKMMTLREDEMVTYDHIYCADTRMYGYI